MSLRELHTSELNHTYIKEYSSTVDISSIQLFESSDVLYTPTMQASLCRVATWVDSLLIENPGLYFKEICQLFGVSNIMIFASHSTHSYTYRKKIQQVAIKRCSQYRGEFMAEVIIV